MPETSSTTGSNEIVLTASLKVEPGRAFVKGRRTGLETMIGLTNPWPLLDGVEMKAVGAQEIEDGTLLMTVGLAITDAKAALANALARIEASGWSVDFGQDLVGALMALLALRFKRTDLRLDRVLLGQRTDPADVVIPFAFAGHLSAASAQAFL